MRWHGLGMRWHDLIVARSAYRLQVRRMREYGANFLASLANIPVMLLITVFVWRVVFGGRAEVNGYGLTDIVGYYLLIRLVSLVVNQAGAVSSQAWQDINSGSLGGLLARPLDYQLYSLGRTAGPMSFYLVVGMGFYAAMALVFRLPLPSAPRLLFTLVSVANGFLIWFLTQFILGILAFWIGRTDALRDLVFEFYALFSGVIIPNDFLPALPRRLAAALPFQQLFYIPVSGLLGRLGPEAMVQALITQEVWITGLFTISRLLWASGVGRFEAQGG